MSLEEQSNRSGNGEGSNVRLIDLFASESNSNLVRDVDPAQALSRLKQAEYDWMISNQIVTPFDYARLVQVIHHPSLPGQSITVSFVTQNVKSIKYRDLHKKKPSKFMACPNCHTELVPNVKKDQNSDAIVKHYCDYGKSRNLKCPQGEKHLDDFTDAAFFFCKPCSQPNAKDYEVCANCFSQNFVRQSLTVKTSEHAYFKGDVFKTSKEPNEQTSTFTNLKAKKAVDKTQDVTCYALIGLWKDQAEQQQQCSNFQCYKQLRVDFPFAITRAGEVLQKEFLFVTDDNSKLFFFHEDGQDFYLNTVQLEDLQSCSDLYYSDVFTMPSQKHKIKYDSVAAKDGPTGLKAVLTQQISRAKRSIPSPRLIGDYLFVLVPNKKLSSVQELKNELKIINWRTSEIKMSIDEVQIILKSHDPKYFYLLLLEGTQHIIVKFSQDDSFKKISEFVLNYSNNFESKVEKVHLNQSFGYIHQKGKRATILLKDNWFCFELNDDRETAEERQIHKPESNCSVIELGDDLIIASKMQRFQKTKDEFTISLGSLNTSSGTMIDFLTKEIESESLKIVLDSEVSQDYVKRLMLPFKVGARDQFYSHILYEDLASGETSCLFVKAKREMDKLEVNSEFQQQIPAWQLPPATRHHIQYPMLAYTTSHPQQNKLMLCNLSKNIPQRRLNLDFTILSFVQAGSYQDEKDARKITIYLLGEKDSQINLYLLQINPWAKINEDEIELTKLDLQIDFETHQRDQIRNCQLIYINKSGKKVVLLIQLSECVLLFQSQKSKTLKKLCPLSKHYTMAPVLLQRGIWNLCYFVTRSRRDGDELVCFQYDEVNHECKPLQTVYQSKAKILKFQLDHEIVPSKSDQHQGNLNVFYLLTDEMQLIQLENKEEHTKTGYIDTNLFVKRLWDLRTFSMKRMFRALELIPWMTCILTPEAIMSDTTWLRKDLELGEIRRERLTYSVENGSFKRTDFLGYTQKLEEQQVACIEHMRQIGKSFQVIREDHFTYFLSMQSIVTKRIDFMSYFQQKALKANIMVLQSVILVSLPASGTCLEFDQKNLLLTGVNIEGSVEIEGNQNDEDKVVKVTGKIKADVSICKYDQFGERQVLYDHKNLTKWMDKEYIENLQKWVKDLQPNLPGFLSVVYFEAHAFVILELKPAIKRQADQDLNLSNDTQNDKKFLNLVWLQNAKVQVQPNITADILFLYNDMVSKIDMNISEVTVTPNHFVFTINKDLILFAKKAQVKVLSEQHTSINDYAVPVQRIKIETMFDRANTVEKGLRITRVNQSDLNIVVNATCSKKKVENFDHDQNTSERLWTQKQSVIQLSFKDTAIMWDLDNDAEISTLSQIRDFDSVESFARTGFRLFNLEEDKPMIDRHYTPYFQNENCSIVSLTETSDRISCCFRLYSAWELQQLLRIQELIETGQKVYQIPPGLLLSNIYGETFFTSFFEKSELLDLAFQTVSELDFDTETQEIQDIYIRRLFYAICLPYYPIIRHTVFNKDLGKIGVANKYFDEATKKSAKDLDQIFKYPVMSILFQQHLKEGEEFKKILDNNISCAENFRELPGHEFKRIRKQRDLQINRHSLTQWLIETDKPILFEKMIRLVLFSNELSIRTLIQQFKHFKSVFNVQSEMVNEFMVKAFIETPMTRRVTQIKWAQSEDICVFTANTAQIAQTEIQARILDNVWSELSWGDKFKSQFVDNIDSFRPVEVRVMEVAWLNGRIDSFYKYVAQQNPGIFENELIKVLLQQQDYTEQIIYRGLLPYITYMICCQWYFVFEVPLYQTAPSMFDIERWDSALVRVLIFVLTIYAGYTELRQIFFHKEQYLYDPYNYIVIGSMVLNLIIVVEHSWSNELPTLLLAHTTSIASVLLWLILFYWMRLFSKTGFYVKLITQTVTDLRYFLFFFLIVICMFASSQFIIDNYYAIQMMNKQDEYNMVSNEITSTIVTDSMISQYLLGLGEFDFSNFQSNESTELVWFYFLAATFFTNIVFLNMLIAIMGDTFDKITEKKERNGLIQQTQICADFISTLKKDEKIDHHKFLYIVTPILNEQAQADDWEGGYNRINTYVERIKRDQKNIVKRQTNKAKSEFSHLKQTVANISKEQKKMIWYVESMNQKAIDHDSKITPKLNENTISVQGKTQSKKLKNVLSPKSNQLKATFDKMTNEILDRLTPSLDLMQTQVNQSAKSISKLQKNVDEALQRHTAFNE